VARVISANIFENQGSSWKFVDYGLIVVKGRGEMKKWLEYSVFELFYNTLARNGGIVGTVRAERRRVGGQGIFTRGGAAFYRVEVRPGRSGAFNAPGLKAPVTKGLKRGEGTV
jgi:hypothetical protein